MKKPLSCVSLIAFFVVACSISSEAQSCSASVSGNQDWDELSWSCNGGMPDPVTPGSYTGDITINGLGNGERLNLNFSLHLDGDLNFNASGGNPTFAINNGDTLTVDGDFNNDDNNLRYEIDGALGVTGTMSGKNNHVFGGEGYVQAGTLDLKNGAGCAPGGCPTILADNCNAGGSFCGDNVGAAPAEPLPVEIAEFRAISKDESVVLVWVTTSEVNNDFFTVQRSKSGDSFELVTEVQGAGMSNTKKEYRVVDEQPYSGLSFYRLKQTDFDGEHSYSEAVSVLLNSPVEFDVEVYPNPVRGQKVYLKVPNSEEEGFEIFVNDLLGQEYITDMTFIEQQGFTMVILELSANLPKGVYFINVYRQGEIQTKKVIVE